MINIKKKYLKNFDLDLYQIVWNLTSQIPEGKVSTYGAIARTLGDIRASRAVGVMEHANPKPIIVPCHRVVYSDGGLGGYGAPEGVAKKIELLKQEGVEVHAGKIVDFKDRLFSDFKLPGTPPLLKLKQEQKKLSQDIQLVDPRPYEMITSIGGIDCSYTADEAFGAAVVLDSSNLKTKDQVSIRMKTRFPYIPTYLSYHELPVAFELLKKLQELPDVLVFDGNGVLHPESLGLATHAGIVLNLPTLGVAKSLLCGELRPMSSNNNKISKVIYQDRLVGFGLHPNNLSTKLVYISPGNLMTFETALELSQLLCKTRMPKPVQIAHMLAKKIRRELY